MKLEDAEKFIKHYNCENCPHWVKNTDEFECDADENCSEVFRESARTIISAGDARITELDEQLRFARNDAIEMAKAVNITIALLEGQGKTYSRADEIIKKHGQGD